ncbi:calnexin-like isoform X4 [Acipenser ruthenus]|uniref:calnexin-like isoform X4 n=1 Tax=Acipenser ruthenus TaxID=7906 RepID=UPI002740DADB|nr:calnexin-like isoform X4 [Acipenser ruthenus]
MKKREYSAFSLLSFSSLEIVTLQLFTVFAYVCRLACCFLCSHSRNNSLCCNFTVTGVVLLLVTYKTPVPTGEVNFAETFDDGSLDGWKISKTMKDDTADEIAKYDGQWEVEPLKENTLPGDKGLVLKSRAKHHAIAAMLQEPFVFEEKPLVVQYEVNFQDGIDCGGAYMKLLSATDDLDLENFYDRTPYTIMFGPDKCGEDYKLHFIFRHKNPQNGDYEEKQAKRADVDLKKIYSDKKTHLYTLVLNPDNSFEIFIDQTSVSKGNLLEDFIPPVNPAKEVDDPNDSKPEDWDEHPKIPNPEETKPDDWDEDAPTKIEDPNAVKPEGWLDDEPEYMSDPNSEKPEDWDEEMDGEWEAPQVPNPACETAPGCGTWKLPLIDNPNYKGKWKPSMIDNPNYQGIWSPRKIPNPDYFEDQHPFLMTPFSAVGLELWSMTSDIYFDNFIICSEKEVADRWAADSWGLKKLVASANEPSVLSQLKTAAEERPWLWIVYILTVGLPLGLVVFFCFPKHG